MLAPPTLLDDQRFLRFEAVTFGSQPATYKRTPGTTIRDGAGPCLGACATPDGGENESTMTTAFAPAATTRETLSVDFRAMGTEWHVEAAGVSETQLAQVSILAEREEQRCSRFRADSTVSLLNRNRSVTDGRLALLASNALAMREATLGAFDPAVGDAVLAAAATCEPDGLTALPANAIEHPCAQELRLTVVGQQVRLEGAGQIDLDGIAKGWTADLLTRYLRGIGASRWLVDVGDDIITGGDDHEERLIGVEATELTIGVGSGAVATSAIGRGHPIIDPRRGEPAEHEYVQATVLASSAATADALATAMLVDPERADGALAGHGAKAILIRRGGDAFMSPGTDEYLR